MKTSAILLTAVLALSALAYGSECETAGNQAEQANGLPPGLLVAIGRIESGRRGSDGRVAAWPWSINAAGQGYYLNTQAEAVALVRSLQARGIRSIDVGCFQVNLMYHATAFATLEEGFDPAANGNAAALFLRELRGTSASWEEAAGRYHSSDPAFGLPYMRQVMASWRGGPAMVSPPMSQVAALVRVIVPQAFAASVSPVLPAPIGPRVIRPTVRPAGIRLPVVIVPSSSRL